MKKLCFNTGLLLLLFPLFLFGQQDTVLLLPLIEVSDATIRQHPIGLNQQTWVNTQLQQSSATNLADLLDRETNLYIKSYGGNSLATSSVRGASAGQTLVLWNGLPIQSPMLGLLDLSLIPTISVEKVQVQKGGSSALWGNGAIGGTISLDNSILFDRKWSASLATRLGSFGYWQQEGQLQWGNKKFQSRSKFSYQQAENDFTYSIAPQLPKRKQTNARFDQQHFLQDLYWKIRPNQTLSAHYWFLHSDRQLPPLTTQTRSAAQQADWANRMLLQWQLNSDQWIYRIKAARFAEHIHYEDLAILLDAPSHFSTWMAEGEVQRSIGAHQKITFGLVQFHTEAEADGYASSVKENRSDGFLSYRLQGEQYGIQVSLHQSINNNNYSPIVPSLGLDYRPKPSWRLHLQISRNYRWPTLNDRFWVPGGNQHLRPEQGWSQELGFAWQLSKARQQFKVQSTLFNRQINDWMLWAPVDGQGFWSANNINKVWSRGLETMVAYQWSGADWHCKIRVAYDYIRSTNQIALQVPRIESGAQLLYTPIHQGFIAFEAKYKSIKLHFRQQYTGATQGVNEAIPAFSIGRLQLHYDTAWRAQNLSLFATIYNLWNADYRVIERRAMPGRNVQIGIRFNFKSRIKNEHGL